MSPRGRPRKVAGDVGGERQEPIKEPTKEPIKEQMKERTEEKTEEKTEEEIEEEIEGRVKEKVKGKIEKKMQEAKGAAGAQTGADGATDTALAGLDTRANNDTRAMESVPAVDKAPGPVAGRKGRAGIARTVDFGASADFAAHVFRVDIPRGASGYVTIWEDYGVQDAEQRVRLTRATWAGIAQVAKAEFNDRLREAKQGVGQWKAPRTKVDKMLGRELCVLAWAAETAKARQLEAICKRWLALRPEERWWLYSMTAASAGLPDDRERGWRKALFHALSDDSAPRETGPKRSDKNGPGKAYTKGNKKSEQLSLTEGLGEEA